MWGTINCEMCDGKISEKKATMGGGVYIKSASSGGYIPAFVMSGGEINDNTVDPSDFPEKLAFSGGAYILNVASSSTITGGTISGNSAKAGNPAKASAGGAGGIVLNNVSLSLIGDATIKENIAKDRLSDAISDNGFLTVASSGTSVEDDIYTKRWNRDAGYCNYS